MDLNYLHRDHKPKLAYRYIQGEDNSALPLVMFLGGYRSDMMGTKATYLEEQCAARGQSFLRFDYSGHGSSSGEFEDGTIGAWLDDAKDIFDHIVQSPAIIIGSSMGGWLALLLARARAEQIHGLIGIAAAPDFTEDMFQTRLNPEQQKQLMTDGIVYVENDYSDEPYAFSKNFYEEAKTHLILNEQQAAPFPIRLIQGKQDADVPWKTAINIQKTYEIAESDLIFVEDGGHSLSRPEDLELINQEVKALSGI